MRHLEELKIPLFYFDMPVMSCGSLAEAIHHKQQQVQRDLPYVYSTESAFNWAIATLHALFYLHEKLHLAHCDLKPENILLARDGSSKLADFSLARDLDIPDRLDYNREKFVGTYKYHAPEIFNNGLITNKIDIFALGVTMFELAEGVCPIDVLQPGAEEKVAVPFLRNGDIPNMTNWKLFVPSDAYRGLMQACLVKDRQFRMSADALLSLDILKRWEPPFSWNARDWSNDATLTRLELQLRKAMEKNRQLEFEMAGYEKNEKQLNAQRASGINVASDYESALADERNEKAELMASIEKDRVAKRRAEESVEFLNRQVDEFLALAGKIRRASKGSKQLAERADDCDKPSRVVDQRRDSCRSRLSSYDGFDEAASALPLANESFRTNNNGMNNATSIHKADILQAAVKAAGLGSNLSSDSEDEFETPQPTTVSVLKAKKPRQKITEGRQTFINGDGEMTDNRCEGIIQNMFGEEKIRIAKLAASSFDVVDEEVQVYLELAARVYYEKKTGQVLQFQLLPAAVRLQSRLQQIGREIDDARNTESSHARMWFVCEKYILFLIFLAAVNRQKHEAVLYLPSASALIAYRGSTAIRKRTTEFYMKCDALVGPVTLQK